MNRQGNPLNDTLEALRGALIAEGCTAESPARLDPIAEQLAREERWT